MDEVDDKLLLTAFHNGVNSDLFIHKLYEKQPQSMAELIHSAQNFMNAKDVTTYELLSRLIHDNAFSL